MSRSHAAVKMTLVGLVGLYSLSNLALFVASCVAWVKAKGRPDLLACTALGLTRCGFTRSALYGFVAAASLISFLSTATMILHSLPRSGSSAVDPLYIFRGIFFTLILMAPIMYIGWSNLHIVHTDMNKFLGMASRMAACGAAKCSAQDLLGIIECDPVLGCSMQDMGLGRSAVGLGGTFVLESLDDNSKATRPAYVMAHVNLLFGALVAAMSAALAPPAGFLVGSHGVGPVAA